MQNKLLTSDMLNRLGMVIANKYNLCHQAEDSRDHLYVECDYMKVVMNKIMQWTHSQNIAAWDWKQHVQEVIRRAKGKSREAQLFKMVYTEIVHCIWIERRQV